MPSAEQILEGLKNIANTYQVLSLFWHLYFSVFVVALLSGARPSVRLSGFLLSLPLLSVGVTAFLSGNPFNGIVFTILSLLLFYFSFKLPNENVSIGPLPVSLPGILMIIFGWVYPHFLNTDTYLSYLYKAPTGLIPCATLSIVAGFVLLLSNLNSRSISLTISIAGLFYGITGISQLGVDIDLILITGSLILLIYSFIEFLPEPVKKAKIISANMTVMGVGPQVAMIIFPYVALALIANFTDPALMNMPNGHNIAYSVFGALLVLIGFIFWASGARTVLKAFKENQLLTSGVFGIVRNPMYSAFIIFFATGAALWMRSWPMLTVPLVAAVGFWFLIKKEEVYLEKTFGDEYLAYKSKVNSLIPFIL